MTVTFFDLLGIDPSLMTRANIAHGMLLPLLGKGGLISLTDGSEGQSDDSVNMINYLQDGLSFSNVRPGVDPYATFAAGPAGQIGFAADMTVTGMGFLTQQPFYLSDLPNEGIQLVPTAAGFPAQVFFTSDDRGHELVIDRLPVKIFLKPQLASVFQGSPSVLVGTFLNTQIDSFAYKLGDDINPTEIDCFIRLRLTPEGDVILEPAVPISLRSVRWMGLPAAAVYDIMLIPSPRRREYLEWTHNDVTPWRPPGTPTPGTRDVNGVVAFRSIEIDWSQPPFSDFKNRTQHGAVHIDNLELVLEDIVFAVLQFPPFPVHGTFGFRRKITDRTNIPQAYSLSGAPVQIPLYSSGEQGGNGGTTLTLQVEQFFFRTGDIHAIDAADQPQVIFQNELIYQNPQGTKVGAQIGIDAEWTIFAGLVMDIKTTPVKFTIADTTIGLVGLKFGVSVGRLGKGIPFKDSYELLGDFYVTAKSTDAFGGNFQLKSLTGKDLSIVAKDIGYKLGHLSLDGLQFPDGMQIIFAKTVRIIIEEMGLVEEPSGTQYFSFSGGVAVGWGGGQTQAPANKPQGNAGDNQSNGVGIRVRRLRFRMHDDDSQPLVKLDGIFLNMSFQVVTIQGYGFMSDYTDTQWHIREWGFGVKVALNAIAMTFSFSAQFMKGSRIALADPTQQFSYFLASMSLGFLPAGPIGLYNIRALVADNMAPNLDATFPDGEGMALLKWHQTHDKALSMPSSRSLSDWVPEDHAFAAGVGSGLSLNGCGAAVHVDIFIFFAKSQAETGLLVVGDLYLLKNPKPIAFVAIEYDIDKEKFGVMVGVNLTLGDLASGAAPDWLANIVSLTGTLYFGNQPWSFAIGQLADQTTWLQLKLQWDKFLTVKFMVGLGMEIVDGGPKGFGFVITLSGGADWGIGSFIVFGSFGFIIGTWKTGSMSMGAEIWVNLGFKFTVFWIFTIGLEAGLKFTYLGKHPWFLTLHAEFKIDMPFFLPDISFSIDKTWQESLPFDTATVTQGLASAAGIDPTAQKDQPLLLPGLQGALGDAGFVYSFNQLNGLPGSLIGDPHTQDIPVVSVDSTIAIGLSQPVSNDSLIATSTYDGTTDTGVQQVQDLSVRYGLASVSVRRAPRFGPTAGAWTDFVTSAQTGFSVGGVAPESLTFAWDTDSRADGKLAPKRLLVNSSSPYSFATQGKQNDQQAAASDPDFPCCGEDRRHDIPKPHVLSFEAIAFGARTPRSERFSGSGGGWWKWALPKTPTVGAGLAGHVAWTYPASPELLGAVDLLDPAAQAQIEAEWDACDGTLFFEAYDGVKLVAQQSASLHTAGSTSLLVTAPQGSRGISRLTARVETGQGPFAGVGIGRVAYVTMADVQRYLADAQRCDGKAKVGPPGSGASGKLAFLPNHDYEIVVHTSIAVITKDKGTRTLQTAEALYFRTKGLPGLNACPNTGDDIRRHVATSYPPRRATPLYRQEPCVLAFENSLSSILPIDRTPGPGDPPEKAQMFPLELNIDRVASLNGLKRLTVPSYDWILAHRADPYPPVVILAQPGFATSKVRQAHSSDPLVIRHEQVKAALAAKCGPPVTDHASQVLLHEPIDENGNPGLWETATGYRATVRQQGGPFAERSGFDIYDLGAFFKQADGTAAATLWSVDADGNLVGPAVAGGRNYASCGELSWDHVQVHARIDLASASAAGIAVGVGDGTPVQRSVLATVEPDAGGHSLVVRLRAGGAETELGRAAVTISGPFLLQVIAYDDMVRASVGSVSVDGPRGTVREGRVALVAEGPALFAGIAVGALDIYSFEFVTSKYASFAEHIGSFDGKLPVLAAAALGGTPASIGSVLLAHGGEVPAAMTASADPQERQRLFDAIVTALGIGLRKHNIAVSAARLTDANGTFGLVVESPEPISLTRDITVTLVKHILVWVPGPGPGPGPLLTVADVARQALATPPGPVPPVPPGLSSLVFEAGQVTAPESLGNLGPGDLIARIAADRIDIYDPPVAAGRMGRASGGLRESMSAEQAARQPAYASIAHEAPGTIVVLKGGGGGPGPIQYGHWEHEDITVLVTALTNGDESKILILSDTPLGPGDYSLQFVLGRDRWPVSSGSDPEQHYHDQSQIPLSW